MAEWALKIKITSQNNIITGHGAKSENGHPFRAWSIRLVAMNGDTEVKGKLSVLLDHVEYILHPTFESPRRVIAKEPYLLKEKGWGEFDMQIILHFVNDVAKPAPILFDLNFLEPIYSTTEVVVFRDPSPELIALLSSNASPAYTAFGGYPPNMGARSGNDLPYKHEIPRSSGFHAGDKRSRESPLERMNDPKKSKSPKSPGYSLTSLSPSTPTFSHSNNAGRPFSNYAAASPPSFLSPLRNGMTTSPYTFTDMTRTPIGLENDSMQFLSDESDAVGKRLMGSDTASSYSRTDDDFGRYREMNGYRDPLGEEVDYRNGRDQTLQNHYLFGGQGHDGNGFDGNRQGGIVDDVYTETDLEFINPIHSANLDPDTRRAWGIPENVNMFELARRLSGMSRSQVEEFKTLVRTYRTDDMTVEEKEGELVIDLYSLGTGLLTALWDFSSSFGKDQHHSSSVKPVANGLSAYSGSSSNGV